MKVSDLIDRLNECPPSAEVYIIRQEDNPLDSSMSIENVFEITGSRIPEHNAVYLCTD